jgi:DNA-binding Xre family transcriptional regulator
MGALTAMTYLRVRELAEERGLTITDLHLKTGISYSTMHAIWHNRVEMYQRSTLDRIAITLGVRVGDLFGGEPEWPREQPPTQKRRQTA